MLKRVVVILAVLTAVALLAGAALMLLGPAVNRWSTRMHHEAITRVFASWEKEVTPVGTLEDARHAADMMEYVRRYCPLVPSYRSNPKTEAALESQRARTLAAYARALEAYSGESFGTDVERWRVWAGDPSPAK